MSTGHNQNQNQNQNQNNNNNYNHPTNSSTHTFAIEPISQFAHVAASIRRPREITCFSYDANHTYCPDASSLRYYYPPYLPADLNRGFDTFRKLDDGRDEHLDGLLDAIVGYEAETLGRRDGGGGGGDAETRKKLDADVVTWRGMMTKIMIVPFSHLDSWEMNATRFQETIFIEENHAKKLSSRDQQHNAPPARGALSQDLMSFWGYKFETLSLLDKPWSDTPREVIEGREDAIVDNYSQYCSVVRTGFGKTKVVIGGEVDAVLDCKPVDNSPINWVELKTSAEVNNDRDQVKFERKLLKFWAQSFLLGVPKIIVGYRTLHGHLQSLEELDVQAIPDKVMRQGKGRWDGQICINFTAQCLDWLKSTITTNGVWRIRKREKTPFLEVFKLEETGTGDILSDSFLMWRQEGIREPVMAIHDPEDISLAGNGNGELRVS